MARKPNGGQSLKIDETDRKKALQRYQKGFLRVTEDEEFSNYFLQDLKDLGATAERILKKVQDILDN